MRAIQTHPSAVDVTAPDCLVDVELPRPAPGRRDLLVRVRAVSVNPVDAKVRAGGAGKPARVLGWDASGVVEAVGPEVALFRPGDAVFYAGALDRPGTNSEWHLVDERLVGHRPSSLDDPAAAALPLTSITAWELLFDRLGVEEGGGEGRRLLVVGAPGGVGSMLVQLARRLTRLTVIGTASNPDSAAWITALGAHEVIDPARPLGDGLRRLGHGDVELVASLTHTEQHLPEITRALAPQGRLALIDDPADLDIRPLKAKSASVHWEFMFTRSMYETADMIQQHHLLERVARLVDEGVLKSSVAEHYGALGAANLRRAHAAIESGRTRGKIVLAGF